MSTYEIKDFTKDGFIGTNIDDPSKTTNFATGDYFNPSSAANLQVSDYYKRAAGSNKYLIGNTNDSPGSIFHYNPLDIKVCQSYWGRAIDTIKWDNKYFTVKDKESVFPVAGTEVNLVLPENAKLPFNGNDRTTWTQFPNACMSVYGYFTSKRHVLNINYVYLIYDPTDNSCWIKYPSSDEISKPDWIYARCGASPVICFALVSPGGDGANGPETGDEDLKYGGAGGAGGNTILLSLDLKYFFSKYNSELSSIYIATDALNITTDDDNINIYYSSRITFECYPNSTSSTTTCHKYIIDIPQGDPGFGFGEKDYGRNTWTGKITTTTDRKNNAGMYRGDIKFTKGTKATAEQATWDMNNPVYYNGHKISGLNGLSAFRLLVDELDIGLGFNDYVLGTAGKAGAAKTDKDTRTTGMADSVQLITENNLFKPYWDPAIKYSYGDATASISSNFCGLGSFRNLSSNNQWGEEYILVEGQAYGGAGGASLFSYRTLDDVTTEPKTPTLAGYGAGGAGGMCAQSHLNPEETTVSYYQNKGFSGKDGVLVVFKLFTENSKPKP